MTDSSDQKGGDAGSDWPMLQGDTGFGKKTKTLFRHLAFAEAAAGL